MISRLKEKDDLLIINYYFINTCSTGGLEHLIQHALVALRESLPNDMELTEKVICHTHFSHMTIT